MVEILGGKPDLDGWVIVQTNGLTLIGQPKTDDPNLLSPVFELKPGIMGGPNGERMAVHPCLPVFLLGVCEIRWPAGSVVIYVSDLHKSERRELSKFVAEAEKMMASLRREQAGIVPAREMPKVTP